ncbi:RNA-binding protein [Roseospira marina]|uniref:RNA-binding protein n=2 Tax=Roseospira marina TaxID=140057 RepID=A0A5M6I3N9_9PROT|nr:RNA-binding protein [Roseospira marina]
MPNHEDGGAAVGENPENAGDETAPMPKGHRRCIVTREVRPRDKLLRFVVSPDGVLVPDVDGRLPGRGLWLSPGRDMIEIAARRRLFSRAARGPVTVPPDLADQVERVLTRRCLSLLGLARRAGQVVTGYEKVRARVLGAADSGPPAALFAARDGAADGRSKMAALATAVLGSVPEGARGRTGRGGSNCRLVVGFDATELGQPLGRERAVHVALERGRLAKGLLEACDRLAGFRPGPMVLSLSEAQGAAVRAAPGAARGSTTESEHPADGTDDGTGRD